MRPFSFRSYTVFGLILLALLQIPDGLRSEESPAGNGRVGLQRLSASQPEIDLAFLTQGSPGLRFENGVRLSPGGGASLDRSLMAFTFDEEAHLLRDRRGLYKVLHADYSSSKEARSGKGSALFRLRNQAISLRTSENLWPMKHEESFTVSFWFRPLYFFRSSNLFRRVSYASEHRKGIEILLEQDRIRLNLVGVLHYGEEIADDVSFLSNKRIEKDRWHHLALAVDARKGVAVLFLDGREEGRFILTRRGVLPEIDFSAPDLAPIVLGGNYIGHLDDLYLIDGAITGESELDISPFGALDYNHHSGRGSIPVEGVVTPVFSLDPALEELHLNASGEAENGSSLRLFYRTSDHPFNGNSSPLPWKRWAELGRQEAPALSLESGEQPLRYIQLKVEWQPDPGGMHTPVLRSLRLEQHLARPPITPLAVRVIEELSRDGRVCLEWRINPEIEIEDSGGYNVHVGVRSGEYEALVDHLPGNKPIRKKNLKEFPLTPEEKRLEERRPEYIKELRRSRIRIFVDNNMLVRARLEHRPRRPLPYLEADHPYYFAVSARIREGAHSRLSAPARVLFRGD